MTTMDKQTLDFLRGTTFSNGHRFDLYESGPAPQRNTRLIFPVSC